MNLRSLYYAISPKSRFLVRKIYYFPADFWNSLNRKKNKYEPKKGDIFIGSGDFLSQGKHHLELLKEYTSLQPDNSLLDVGCGIGRAAVPLTQYLSTKGKYEGFDVVKKGIDWCRKNISKDFSNFNFQHISLNNDLYNLTNQKAENFKFPYEDNSFDTVFLFSVFTHMQPKEVQNYLNEIYRVLKPDGKCLSTFFLYDDQNEEYISKENKGFCFPYQKENYRLMNEKVPSANIAFKEELLFEMIQTSQLKLENKIYGTWSNRAVNDLFDYQDILILKKV
ncbi:class I SAM-dependent methyltransferase [Flavobacterium sp. UBA7680]|uniref:class I SAM-dependent methyltransferase n=1 Tax=Flavobacterium sp. UBA7680 TaxID=1946559 RepID=UPI0025BFB231|nr:class I SAM-dependent methyltransferase [Flavobacterium sp. UBA7680]